MRIWYDIIWYDELCSTITLTTGIIRVRSGKVTHTIGAMLPPHPQLLHSPQFVAWIDVFVGQTPINYHALVNKLRRNTNCHNRNVPNTWFQPLTLRFKQKSMFEINLLFSPRGHKFHWTISIFVEVCASEVKLLATPGAKARENAAFFCPTHGILGVEPRNTGKFRTEIEKFGWWNWDFDQDLPNQLEMLGKQTRIFHRLWLWRQWIWTYTSQRGNAPTYEACFKNWCFGCRNSFILSQTTMFISTAQRRAPTAWWSWGTASRPTRRRGLQLLQKVSNGTLDTIVTGILLGIIWNLDNFGQILLHWHALVGGFKHFFF